VVFVIASLKVHRRKKVHWISIPSLFWVIFWPTFLPVLIELLNQKESSEEAVRRARGMGKKGKWFDAVQRILSTSEPDPVEADAKV